MNSRQPNRGTNNLDVDVPVNPGIISTTKKLKIVPLEIMQFSLNLINS